MSIILDNVSYVYGQNEGYIKQALKDINLVIGKNEFIGLIGHTGSGKSTMTQILNGLLVPTTGNMYFEGLDTKERNYARKSGSYFNTLNTSFLKQQYSKTCVSDLKIWVYHKKNVNYEHLKH